jgi:hypothetical protein
MLRNWQFTMLRLWLGECIHADITDPAVEKPRAMFSPPGSFHPVRRMRVIQLVPFAEVWLK